MSEQITVYNVSGVIEADPGSQFVWVKYVDAQTVMDVNVAVAEQSAFDRCHLILTEERREAERSTWDRAYAAALDAAREAVKGVNWFNDEGKMLSAIVATAESLAAIDALRKDAQ